MIRLAQITVAVHAAPVGISSYGCDENPCPVTGGSRLAGVEGAAKGAMHR